VRREADFYGAMDGAIRFTQRDALAAVLITVVNIVAGLIIGVVQHGLDLATAAETYTILTVGEGLVTAIPALLVSMSGGLITTRAASESHLGEEVAVQLLARARPLAAAAAVLVALSLIPGLPKLSFLFVAGILAAAAYANRRSLPLAAAIEAEAAPAPSDAVEPVVAVDALGIQVGYALVTLVDEKQGGTLLGRVRAIRRQIAAETGMVVPPVHVTDNLQLPPRAYAILVKGVDVARGELHTDRLLAINPGAVSAPLDGVATSEPAFGLPATWITQDRRDLAIAAGYTVVDPTTAISTHLSEVIRAFLPDLLTRQYTKDLIDRLAQTAPKLVEEIVPKVCSVGDVQRVLRQLLRERVPVRDLTTILEAIADAAAASKDPDVVTEAVRVALGRSVCRAYQSDNGDLRVIAVSPALEDALAASVTRTDRGAVLAIEPDRAQRLASRLGEVLAREDLAQPVLLCTPTLRPHLWRLFSRALPHIAVLSHSEVPPTMRVLSVATLD
jgi:flagellar biosynthesis protein FlhA